MRSPSARSATIAPMLPRPTTPRILLHTSVPDPLRAPTRPARTRGGGLRDVAREREQHGDRVLGGGDVAAAGRVHDHDAALGRRVDVDVVDADAGAADDAQRVRPRASTSAVTLVPLRTMSASKPRDRLARAPPAAGRARASTSSSGCSRRRREPLGAERVGQRGRGTPCAVTLSAAAGPRRGPPRRRRRRGRARPARRSGGAPARAPRARSRRRRCRRSRGATRRMILPFSWSCPPAKVTPHAIAQVAEERAAVDAVGQRRRRSPPGSARRARGAGGRAPSPPARVARASRSWRA